MFSCLLEGWVKNAVGFDGTFRGDIVVVGEVADSGFEEVLLDRPLHEIVIDGGFGDTLVVGNGCEVVAIEGCEVCELEVELVGESVTVLVRTWVLYV